MSDSSAALAGQGNLAVGIALSVAACAMNAFGMNMQRLASNATSDSKCSKGARQAVGAFFSTACAIPDVISYGYAPQAVLAPFAVITIVLNLALSPILHDEKIVFKDVALTSMVVAGVATCISSGGSAGQDDTVYDLPDLVVLFWRPSFQRIFLPAAVMLVLLVVHLCREESAGRAAALTAGVAYPVIAGTLGGTTVLLGKVLAIVLKNSSDPWLVVPTVASVATCAVGQLTINARGLSKHSPKVLVPIFCSCFMLSNAILGGVFFRELERLSDSELLKYSGGVLLVVTSVMAIAGSAAREQQSGKKK